MRRRSFLQGLAGGTAGALAPVGLSKTLYALGAPPERGLLIAVASDAPAAVQDAARSIAATSGHPLLHALMESGAAKVVDSRRLLHGGAHDLAYNHLILVGAIDDPLIVEAWQREARPTADGIYIFGFGHFKGDIGYVESDRNPFLHSQSIAVAPYETQVITITGTTEAGIQIAVDAFLRQSLVNGVVAAKGWTRPAACLLERDALAPGFAVPSGAPEQMGDAARIAWTQAAEDEYRGVLADTGVMPQAIWRAKYYAKGNWDRPGSAGSFENYAAGLHRRAYGNTLWMARFSDAREASAAAPKIAGAARLRPSGGEWKGDQPPYASGTYPGEPKVPGTLTLTRAGEWVTISAIQNGIG